MNIVVDTMTLQPTIWLYPKGFGTIRGRVVDSGSKSPLKNVKITLRIYKEDTYDPFGSIYDKTVNTDSGGDFVLNQVLETWPPPDIEGNSYFNHKHYTHEITISLDGYYPKTIDIDSLEAGQVLDLGDITLNKKGSTI